MGLVLMLGEFLEGSFLRYEQVEMEFHESYFEKIGAS